MMGCVIYSMLPVLYVQLFRQGMPQPGGPVEQRQTNSHRRYSAYRDGSLSRVRLVAPNHTLGPFTMCDSTILVLVLHTCPPSEFGKMPLQTLYSSYTVTKLLVGCGSVWKYSLLRNICALHFKLKCQLWLLADMVHWILDRQVNYYRKSSGVSSSWYLLSPGLSVIIPYLYGVPYLTQWHVSMSDCHCIWILLPKHQTTH